MTVQQTTHSMIPLVTIATHDYGYLSVLKQGAYRNGYELHVLGFGQKWEGFGMKFRLLGQWLKNVEPSQIFVLLDGFDTLCLEPSECLLPRFLSYNCDILLSRDVNITNPIERYIMERMFPRCNGVGICAGMYMGRAGAVAKMVELLCGVNDEHCISNTADDQRMMIDMCQQGHLFYQKHVKIDVDCRVFLNIPPDGFFTRSVTTKNNHNMQIYNSRVCPLGSTEPVVFVQGLANADLTSIVDLYGFNDTSIQRPYWDYVSHLMKSHYKLIPQVFFVEIMLLSVIIVSCVGLLLLCRGSST